MTNFSVNGKSAVITGGTTGLGLDIAETFLRNGASHVFITSRKEKNLRDALAQLHKVANSCNSGAVIDGVATDVSNAEGVAKLVTFVSQKIDKLDILIANAGASWGAPIDKHPPSAMDKVLDLNVKGVFYSIQQFLPMLRKAGTQSVSSRVVIMASVAGLTPVGAGAGTYGYVASKAGVIHLGKNLAIELGKEHINVNMIAPGFIPTNMSNGLLQSDLGKASIAGNPKRKLGKPKDVSDAVLFLCDDATDYINGVVLPVDGGANLVAGGLASKL